MASVLTDAGYDAEFHWNGATIRAHRDGDFHFEVTMSGCEGDVDQEQPCDEFYFSRSLPDLSRSLEEINSWNARRVVGRAYLDDGMPFVEFGVHIGRHEPAPAFIREQLNTWHKILSEFRGDTNSSVAVENACCGDNDIDIWDDAEDSPMAELLEAFAADLENCPDGDS